LHQHQIIAYIQKIFVIKYTVPRINKWSHQNRFSYKKPKGVPHKFDEVKQTDFIKYYEALKETLGDVEPLLFKDAVHPA
jgi:transposase